MSGDPSTKQIFIQFAYLTVSLVGSAFLMKWASSQLDPQKEQKKKAALFKKALQRRLGRNIETDTYEDTIAMDVINPRSIEVELKDVGGHADTKRTLNLKVILPLTRPDLFNSYLLRQPKGVLLYGPPGTGKTMLAKALAKEAQASFINIKASSIQSKWFGETQKLVHALFSLANKLQPCIIFIDEVDALLGRRKDHEHEATTTMKTEFMQLWDGFLTDSAAQVMILAATNRPYDLDEAVLRRFTLQLEVPMPDAQQREAILGIILKKHATSLNRGPKISRDLLENVATPEGRRPQAQIAEQTAGFSGSDLKELCSQAATISVQDVVDREIATPSGTGRLPQQIRDISVSDFLQALRTFRPSSNAAEAYRTQMARHGHVEQDSNPQLNLVLQAMNLLRVLNATGHTNST